MTNYVNMLPRFDCRSRWLSAARLSPEVRAVAEEVLRVARDGPGWHPPRKRLTDRLFVVDVTAEMVTGALSSIRVMLIQDHPILRRHPDLPRAVRSLYRGDVRAALTLSLIGWDAVRKQDAAWAAWRECRAQKLKGA